MIPVAHCSSPLTIVKLYCNITNFQQTHVQGNIYKLGKEHKQGKDKATGGSIGKALRHSPNYSPVRLLHTHPM